MSKFINPFTDVGFKRIFGQRNSNPILLAFDEDVRAYRDTKAVMKGQYLLGKEEGRTEERQAIARNMKANGVPMDVIAKSLNITREAAEALLTE